MLGDARMVRHSITLTEVRRLAVTIFSSRPMSRLVLADPDGLAAPSAGLAVAGAGRVPRPAWRMIRPSVAS